MDSQPGDPGGAEFAIDPASIRYPEELPVTQCRAEILAAIREHQVVVVAGETGSGKTTQLPKLCLEAGRGVAGLIGHTQPRRLAARTVAERIAEELGTPPGGLVGYQVRFTGTVGEATRVKLMTDGILLTEIQRDRMLRRYDTLIIDEAHERSLNIDFILGYLRRLLPRRPDLKLLITSATIDQQRFAAAFAGPDGTPAPVLEVSGRVYPVEIRYRPIEDPEVDQTQAILDAVDELDREPPGDVLVFLSGEREIRDTAEALRRAGHGAGGAGSGRDAGAGESQRGTGGPARRRAGLADEVLPLFARLSTAEQHRVFAPHPGRRIVLATNVAETSLTVPGIRYVIDPGTARISRYSNRLKVQRLPIEPVSQASANQRAGRCGRVADGVCIRLYGEDDFASRPEFTEPEILRTSLASVVLQMAAAGLGDPADFPFIDPPDRRHVRDGVELLHELGALAGGRLTKLGREMARLPVDPRLGRMIIEAGSNGCVPEVLVIAAALSIQDPRERPADARPAADQSHARFADPESDFVSYLNLWRYLRERQRELSGNQFRRMCRTEFLNYLRVREWQDLVGQLRQVARTLGLSTKDPGRPPMSAKDPGRPPVGDGVPVPVAGGESEGDGQTAAYPIHVSLLAGLLSHVGMRDERRQDYLGARGGRFAIFPGSALAKKQPRWVMSAELVETSRLFARVNARVEPQWVEKLAGHLVKRSYSEPHWEKKRAAVMASEKVTLYGIPLVAARSVNFGRIDPMLSRELFIRHALVEGDWETRHEFFAANRRLLDEVEDLEHRVRRRDILVDDEALFAFYDRRLPADVVSGRHFDAWWKRARRTDPDLLSFEKAMLVGPAAQGIDPRDYPDEWRQGDLRLPLTYQFEPGAAADGVTVHIPLAVLGQVSPVGFDWQVPGLREELLTALLRTLPKAQRVNFVPVPDTARAVLAALGSTVDTDVAFLSTVEHELLRLTGVRVPPDAWAWDKLPEHLKMTFRIEDGAGAGGRVGGRGGGRDGRDGAEDGPGGRGRPVAEGKDLGAIKDRLAGRARAAVVNALAGDLPGLERTGLRDFPDTPLPEQVERTRDGYQVRGFPALVPEGGTVAVRVFDDRRAAARSMWVGTRALLVASVPSAFKVLAARLSNQDKLALARNPHGGIGPLVDDCVAAAVDHLMTVHGGPVRDAAGFAKLREAVRAEVHDTLFDVVRRVAPILAEAARVGARLTGSVAARPGGVPGGTRPAAVPAALQPAYQDMRDQLAGLVHPGFVTETGLAHLADLPRYLRAIGHRLDKLSGNQARDADRMRAIHEVVAEYQQAREELPDSPELVEVRWMIEELRINYFAQGQGTAYPISDVRIYRALDAVTG